MKLYFAAASNPKDVELLHGFGVHRFLLSFYEVKKKVKTGEATLGEAHGFLPEDEIFLDSGAWSAFNAGAKIDLRDYMNFLAKHPDLKVYANLDDIGSGQRSEQNLRIMESEGLHPLPVYHRGEPVEVLRDMVGSYDYVALGGIASEAFAAAGDVKFWLARIMDTYPKHRFHLFGVTNTELFMLYNPYSCDSTSWHTYQRYADVPRIVMKNANVKIGKTPYDELSEMGKRTHFLGLPPEEQSMLVLYLLALDCNPSKIIVDHDPIEGTKAWVHFLQMIEKVHDHFTPTFERQQHLAFAIPDYVRAILKETGIELDNEVMENTPRRVADALKELLAGYSMDPHEILSKRFKVQGTGWVTREDIPFFSLCEHHLLPFFGTVQIAYRPATSIDARKDGGVEPMREVFGLSKLDRLVECFSRRLSLQERMTDEIANALAPFSTSVIVRSRARHMCIEMRGANSSGETVYETKRGLIANEEWESDDD